MQTQHNFAMVLREVSAGHEVGITRHRKLVAKLVPVELPGPVVLPDFGKRARKIWKSGWQGASTEELLDEARGGQ